MGKTIYGNTIYEMLRPDQQKLFPYPKRLGEPVPRERWKKSELYSNMLNSEWFRLSKGAFPASGKKDDRHTLYVLRAERHGCAICPTSTARQYDQIYWYIEKGADLGDGIRQDKRAYVLKLIPLPLPKSKIEGEDNLYYEGVYPEEKLRREYHDRL